MRIHYLSLVFIVMLASACAMSIPTRGHLGYGDGRRAVIVGENVEGSIALYYQRKYDAYVWFTPYEGKVANAANNLFQSGLGPSTAIHGLIVELQSINDTVGRWEIIVPKDGERYLLTALKNMKSGSLSKARGTVVMLDSRGSSAMEHELERVTGGTFFVMYEGKE